MGAILRFFGRILYRIYTIIMWTTVTLLASWVYVKLTMGKCRSYATMMNKIVLITGAHRGIGLAAAKQLATRGAKVIVLCRTQQTTTQTVRTIKADTLNENVEGYNMDLSSLEEVKKIASDICKKIHHIDVLILNAAVPPQPFRQTTKDSFETTMQVNYFSNFLLVHLLLPLLRKVQQARIVLVVDKQYSKYPLEMTNLQMERDYLPLKAYCVSKLCLVYLTRELAQRLTNEGITVNCCNPGVSKTKFFESYYQRIGKYGKLMSDFVIPVYGRTAERAADNIILLSVCATLRCTTGKYFSDCEQMPFGKLAMDDAMAKQLYEQTAKLLQIKPLPEHAKSGPGPSESTKKDHEQ